MPGIGQLLNMVVHCKAKCHKGGKSNTYVATFINIISMANRNIDYFRKNIFFEKGHPSILSAAHQTVSDAHITLVRTQ
jgi:hypothetical protein